MIGSRYATRASWLLCAVVSWSLHVAPAGALSACPGDCDENYSVGVSELLVCVNIVLGTQPASACPSLPAADVAHLVRAVVAAIGGCPPPPSTTPTAHPTAPPPTATRIPERSCNLRSGHCVGGERDGQPCTRNGLCVAGTCDTSGFISRVELNIAALDVPLSFVLEGRLALRLAGAGDTDPVARCDALDVEPVNIPCIGFLCFLPSGATCPDGTIDCAGGASTLSIEVTADSVIGDCAAQADCAAQCAAHCAALGAAVRDSGCTGYCVEGAPRVCTADAQCPDGGGCYGPDPIGSFGGICQCACLDLAAGEPARPGEFQCHAPVSVTIESSPPCDGQALIDFGGDCLPLTTATASGAITHANFDPPRCAVGPPPCRLPADGDATNIGAPLPCAEYDRRLDGVALAGMTSFFGTPFGDALLELTLVCR